VTPLAELLGLWTWIGAGIAAAIIARLLPWSRRSLGLELLAATSFAVLAGFAATALDFGGLSVIEWRAVAFAFFTASAAVAGLRLWAVPSS
jgi:hypothetical protein